MLDKASDEESKVADPTETPSHDVESSQPKPQSNWSGKRNLLIGIAVGVVLTSVGMRILGSMQEQSSTTAAPAVTETTSAATSVTAADVETTAVNRTLEATGTVEAFEMIPVLSEATDLQIEQVLAQESEWVEAGQTLARLDDSVLQAQLEQAQASVAESQARLAELEAGTRSEEVARARERLSSAEAAVRQAQSDLDLARKRERRNRTLEAEGAIARDRLDEVLNEVRNQEANLQQAQAQRREAQQELAELEAGPRPEAIAQARAQLAQAQAQARLISAQLQDTRIVAPVSGKIATRNARVGDVTSSSEQLFEIIENGRLELQLKVPETQLAQIEPGQKVEITSDSNSSLQLSGEVREINPTVDEESRQAVIEVDLPTADFRPGMFLRGAIVTSATTGLTLPAGAILPQADGSAIVYLLHQADNTVAAQTVETGAILSGERVEIVDGLNRGDRVVIKGAAYLKDGDRVEVRNRS